MKFQFDFLIPAPLQQQLKLRYNFLVIYKQSRKKEAINKAVKVQMQTKQTGNSCLVGMPCLSYLRVNFKLQLKEKNDFKLQV